MQFVSAACLSTILILAGKGRADDNTRLYLHGSGWYQFGRIMNSTDTLSPTYNYDGNWNQNSGAQFTVEADIGDNMQGAMGLGGQQFHNAQGATQNTVQTLTGFAPYITQARLTYFMGTRESYPLMVNLGLFPYQYNRDVRNLGSYLFRGPVYPGVLISEFESKSLDTTIANILGLMVRHKAGDMFTQDLILRSETEFPPIFDLSLGYVANLKLGKTLEVGVGANFYRLFSMKPEATDLTDRSAFAISDPATVTHPYEGNYAYIQTRVVGDTTVNDTTFLTHRGIKLMGRFSFDPKPWFDPESLGPNDLKIYSEVAVVGIKNYKGVYPDIAQRIPVMVGFNLPTFRLLDEAVVEVEWYGAPFRDDYRRLYKEASPIPQNNGPSSYSRAKDSLGNVEGSKVAFSDPYDVTNMKKDDLKWSFYMSKTFQNYFKVSLQAANDHYKPNTPMNSDAAIAERMESAFTTMKDWYLMCKLGFAF